MGPRALAPPRLLPLALLLPLLLLGSGVRAASDKRAENEFLSPMPFVLGSRYGRSPQRLITPRNDRFFMGSRYGKRSGLDPLGTRSAMGFTLDAGGTIGMLPRLLTDRTERLTNWGTGAGDLRDVRQGETRPGAATRLLTEGKRLTNWGVGEGRLGETRPALQRLGDTTLPLECAPTATSSLYHCVPARSNSHYRRPDWWAAPARPRAA